jgi:hypothetical protein
MLKKFTNEISFIKTAWEKKVQSLFKKEGWWTFVKFLSPVLLVHILIKKISFAKIALE